MRGLLCSYIGNVKHSALPGWSHSPLARFNAFLHHASERTGPEMALLLMFILHPLHVVREGPVATPFKLGCHPLDLLDREWED